MTLEHDPVTSSGKSHSFTYTILHDSSPLGSGKFSGKSGNSGDYEPLEKDPGKMNETKLLSSSQESLSEKKLRRRVVPSFFEEDSGSTVPSFPPLVFLLLSSSLLSLPPFFSTLFPPFSSDRSLTHSALSLHVYYPSFHPLVNCKIVVFNGQVVNCIVFEQVVHF
jgi:hypothetical protein